MKVLIIEDELLTAEELAAVLQQTTHSVKVVNIVASVKEAVAYLTSNPMLDLIFCDIQLGDGHSFEIFKQVNQVWPVIFCTAYNEHALEAFNHHGIGYILKPFSLKTIQHSLDQFIQLRTNLQQNNNSIHSILQEIKQLQVNQTTPASLLVNWKDKIIPVKLATVALFTVDYKTTRIFTNNNQSYSINQTLEEIEKLCGSNFYRANRQFIVNRSAIEEVVHYHARKLFIKLTIKGDFDITIAKAKIPDFLDWLKQ